jgi:Sigma-70, region 4
VRDLSQSGAQRNSARQPQLRATHYARPLYVLVAALLAESSPGTDVDALGEDDLLRQLLSEHETKYWDLWAQRRKLVLDPEDQRAAVAVATLLTARGDHEALTITLLIPHHGDEPESRLIAIARWLGQLYPADGQPGRINIGPLEPDRLGEVLTGDVLRQRPTLLAAAMDAASDRQLTNLLTVVARTARDDQEVRGQLQECLDTRTGDLLSRALTPPGSREMLTAISAAAVIARPDWLYWAVGTLSVREAGIISMRFGLTDGQPKTLDEMSKAYGLTRERVRQIERVALSKLRHPSRAPRLTSPDYPE